MQLSLEIPSVIIPNSRSNIYLRQFFLNTCSVCAFLFPTVHKLDNPCFYLTKATIIRKHSRVIVNSFDSVSLKMPLYAITDHLTYTTSLKNIPNIDFGR